MRTKSTLERAQADAITRAYRRVKRADAAATEARSAFRSTLRELIDEGCAQSAIARVLRLSPQRLSDITRQGR